MYTVSQSLFIILPKVFSFGPGWYCPSGCLLGTDIPLTYAGIKILGPKFGVKTIVGLVLASAFMDGITMLRNDGSAALVDDVLLSCVFGGVLIGFGLGLIFKSRATSGGSDIIAMILAKYTNIQLGQLLIYVDSVIVLVGCCISGWKIPLYSCL